MRRIVQLASLGFACLGAVQAAIAAFIYRVQELFPLPGHARPRVSRFFLSALVNIAVAGFLAQLATTANGAELYVSSTGTDEVKRYDAATGAFLGNFVTAGSGGLNCLPECGLGFGPDGNLYVASNGARPGNVLRYSGASGAFLGVFASSPGGVLNGLGFGPDSNLYVSIGTGSFGPESEEVVRFDSKTGAFIDVFTKDPPGINDLRIPWGFKWGPDGNLYVASNLNGQVHRYNGTTGVLIDVFVTLGLGAGPLDLTFGPDGNLYVASGSVQRFDGLSGAFIDVFASGGGLVSPIGLQFGPDGNLYVSSAGTDQVLRYNGLTGAFIDVFASGGGLERPSFLIFRTVPEPSALWLLCAAVVGLFAVSRRVAPARSASRHHSSDC